MDQILEAEPERGWAVDGRHDDRNERRRSECLAAVTQAGWLGQRKKSRGGQGLRGMFAVRYAMAGDGRSELGRDLRGEYGGGDTPARQVNVDRTNRQRMDPHEDTSATKRDSFLRAGRFDVRENPRQFDLRGEHGDECIVFVQRADHGRHDAMASAWNALARPPVHVRKKAAHERRRNVEGNPTMTLSAGSVENPLAASTPRVRDARARSDGARRILVVGSGTRFLSGISYYTIRLANALAEVDVTAVITMRQLLPTRFYPGHRRVGDSLTRLDYDSSVRYLASVDWYWLPSLVWALVGMLRFRPEHIVFQWWTGTVLHSYLALALLARLIRAKVVIEFHEVLDTGEERMPLVRRYVSLLGPVFVKLAAGFVIHSEVDREPITRRFRLGRRPCVVIPHGPYDHHVASSDSAGLAPRRDVPDGVVNVLFFGIIRPFKGLEDLVEAFDGLSAEEAKGYRLTVVGETWEGWDHPIRLIEKSRNRERITLVNRYVHDREVADFFSKADAVALPYHRSSASGPAHVAMSHGLPLIITAVGGLPAAVEGYEGALLIPPHDAEAIREAIRRLPALIGKRYADPHSWARTRELFADLFTKLEGVSGG
jgi:glycosyltransferase involved in cell wall biosynthesis